MTELPRPEFLVEIEAFGVAGDGNSGWPVNFHKGQADHRAASVQTGELVYYSANHGQGSIEDQITGALDNLRAACEQAGTSLDKVIKTNMMLTDTSHYGSMRRLEVEYYEQHAPNLVANPPACTFMQVEAIETPDTLFQVDAIGVM